jgi:hypothetical protein
MVGGNVFGHMPYSDIFRVKWVIFGPFCNAPSSVHPESHGGSYFSLSFTVLKIVDLVPFFHHTLHVLRFQFLQFFPLSHIHECGHAKLSDPSLFPDRS